MQWVKERACQMEINGSHCFIKERCTRDRGRDMEKGEVQNGESEVVMMWQAQSGIQQVGLVQWR